MEEGFFFIDCPTGNWGFRTIWGRPFRQLNEYLLLDKSEREALKCLTGGKAPFLKDLLSEDVLVNVGLSLADPKGNTSYFIFYFLVRSSFLFFDRYSDGFLLLAVAAIMRPEVEENCREKESRVGPLTRDRRRGLLRG